MQSGSCIERDVEEQRHIYLVKLRDRERVRETLRGRKSSILSPACTVCPMYTIVVSVSEKALELVSCSFELHGIILIFPDRQNQRTFKYV